jgi:hypothetical protein
MPINPHIDGVSYRGLSVTIKKPLFDPLPITNALQVYRHASD